MTQHARRRTPLLLVLAAVCVALPAFPAMSQMDALRRNDGVFIEGLVEEGMAELFGRFVEQAEEEGGLEPIAQQTMVIAQRSFAASDGLKRAIELAGVDPQASEALFAESRAAYEQMLAAQKRLIDDNIDDERAPIWQTDLVALIFDTYLPTYHNNATWAYEFGLPTPAQQEAYEKYVPMALAMSATAMDRLERLTGRLSRDGGDLRTQLETMGIFFKLREDYGQKRTPFWFAHSAYYATLLPDTHPYYRTVGNNPDVPNQANTVENERKRLRGQAELIVTGQLLNDPQVTTVMRLMAGRVLVSYGEANRVQEGIDGYLEAVITGSADSWQGFIASLAKARGRALTGDIDTAVDILAGMDNHTFVRQQRDNGNIAPRLLAADLLHRMLREPADQARGADRAALLAEAYEKPYLELIQNDSAGRIAPLLYNRWANQMDAGDDPGSLPPMVRMGVGQMKTEQGGGLANELILLAQQDPLTNYPIPAEQQREVARRGELRAQAEEVLNVAITFNQTLTAPETEDALRATGMMNLGFNRYYLAELAKYYGGQVAPAGVDPYVEVAKLWSRIGIELPDAPQAEQATAFATILLQAADASKNIGPQGVTDPAVRTALREASDALYEFWPRNPNAHTFRVYIGFYVYEIPGELDKAIEVYRGMPSDHPDYFEARRQMILAMQKVYDNLHDERMQLELTGAAEDTPEARMVLERSLAQRDEDLARMRRELLQTAKLLELNAEDEAENATDARRQFSARTAQGGAIVAVAAMESDEGAANDALRRLEGFEDTFNPSGRLANLVEAQPDPVAASQQLDGLIQSAQERRILALVQAADISDPAERAQIGQAAEVMIQAYPDVASGVVNGVLQRIEDQIERLQVAANNALLPVNRAEAERQLADLATVAVDLSQLLVTWANDQGYRGTRLLPFETGLCRALLLSNRAGDAVPIMNKWIEEYPNNFDVVMLTADCILAAARDANRRGPRDVNPGLEQYTKVINYYNAQPGEKPARFWEAWLKTLLTYEYIGGEQAERITGTIRMLENRVDENLGGPDFQPKFEALYARHLR